jgi:hypothetical protein
MSLTVSYLYKFVAISPSSVTNTAVKFIPIRDFDIVTQALNFTTPDLDVIGGCDLYTTKAAGGDKKLYKNIETGLEAQYNSNLQFSNSLSPPQAHLLAPSLNLSRSSPFGNLGMISSRRTYAYLIATLNASHPDYDFSHLLRPTDFKRERHLRTVMNTLDTTMYNLRPRPVSSTFLNVPSLTSGSAPPTSQGYWSPGIWRLIDQQMTLKECSIYRYAPEEHDLFEDEDEGAIWSMHYFFFNKARKRVCYLYLRAVSVLSHSPCETPRTPIRSKRLLDSDSEGWLTPDSVGARKRKHYWLGDREGVKVAEHDDAPSEGIIEAEQVPPCKRRPLVDEHDNYILSDEEARSDRSTVRGISEEIAAAMEV